MKIQTTLKIIATIASGIWAGAAFAHDDHAMLGHHWHATDVLGFVVLAGFIALTIWLSNGDK